MPARARAASLARRQGPWYPPPVAVAETQTPSSEPEVRSAIEAALQTMGGTTVTTEAGLLTMDLGGSVRNAYLAGPFQNRWKLPMRLVVTTEPNASGTHVLLDVHSRGTAGGLASGDLIGASKQRKVEKEWLAVAFESIPYREA